MNDSFESAPRLIACHRKSVLALLTLAFVVICPAFLFAQSVPKSGDRNSETGSVDQLEAEKTWQLKTEAQTLEAIEAWIDETPNSPANALETAVKAFHDSSALDAGDDSSSAADRLDRVIAALASLRPDIGEIARQLSGQRKSVLPPNFSHVLDNQDEHLFVRDHVRLLVGRWLTQNQFYEEALEQLATLDVDTLLTPESALFYQALAEHQLLRKSDFKNTVETLLQHESKLPVRFAVISKMMQADLTPVKEGSLDEISRMMKDNHRHIELRRSGTLVLQQEADVIEKLDKLIEDLEEQQQQAQNASNAQGSAQPSGQPMQDSQSAQGQGDGKVTVKDLADGGQWGDLEPAERSAAMAEMVKDMPPHFRSAIEKYFRRLAARESGQEGNQ